MTSNFIAPKRLVVYLGAVGIPLAVAQSLFGTSLAQQIQFGITAALLFAQSTLMSVSTLRRRRSTTLLLGGTATVVVVLILYLRFIGGREHSRLAPWVAATFLVVMSWIILRRDDAG